jgi:hypothetical protein
MTPLDEQGARTIFFYRIKVKATVKPMDGSRAWQQGKFAIKQVSALANDA